MNEQPDFESWWEEHGQYGRAGGGQYEKTFASNAWREQAERIRVLRAALRPFAEVDLCTKGFHQNFAMHVLQARAALKATK